MSNKIKLKHPIKSADGSVIEELDLRRVTVGDLEVMEKAKTQLAQSVKMISMLAEISEDDVRKMDAEDFAGVSDLVADFLG